MGGLGPPGGSRRGLPQEVAETEPLPQSERIAFVGGSENMGEALRLLQHTGTRVYLQVGTFVEAQTACSELVKTGWLGRRVFVGYGPLDRIHLADNLVDFAYVGKAKAPHDVRLAQALGAQLSDLDQDSHLPGEHGKHIERLLSLVPKLAQQSEGTVRLVTAQAVDEIKDVRVDGSAHEKANIFNGHLSTMGIQSELLDLLVEQP